MFRRPLLALALLALFAPPVFAQDGEPVEDEGPSEEEIAAKVEAEVDTRVEIKGNRFTVKLKRGAVVEGILPNGLRWERLDILGDYVDADEMDDGSGLRLQYVMGMDGDVFIRRELIAVKDDGSLHMRDLGELTEEQKRSIRERVIADRRKMLLERERRFREELDRLRKVREEAEERRRLLAGEDGEGGDEAGGKTGDEAKKVAKTPGAKLLERFPPEDGWGEDKLKEILRREVVNGIYRNDEEAAFIDGFEAWKEALATREANAEAEADAAGKKAPAGGK